MNINSKKKINTLDFLTSREFGILSFNQRVLAQARDINIPILERLKYICILSSNMDEFFEVIMSTILTKIRSNSQTPNSNSEFITKRILSKSKELIEEQYLAFNEEILPELKNYNIKFSRRTEWNNEKLKWVENFFVGSILPIITPISLDPAHPFPRLLNKSLNFAVELNGHNAFNRKIELGIVQAPRVLPRIFLFPKNISNYDYEFVFLSSIVHANMHKIFPGIEVIDCHQFRVTRNSELFVDDDEVEDLRGAVEGEILHRQFGDAVRIEVDKDCPEHVSDFLIKQYKIRKDLLFKVNGPVNLVRLMSVFSMVKEENLKFNKFKQHIPENLSYKNSIFSILKQQDILLHHPYESFIPVLDFLESASTDPDVVAIKQTVYRTGEESLVMEKLITAARNGKDVTVVVELFARFDEERNVGYSQKLEDAGAKVVYGVFGCKTHAKMLLIFKKEKNKLRSYCHLSTGNYNFKTSAMYTDFSLFTDNPQICNDVNSVFFQLTGTGKAITLKKLWMSPFKLEKNLIAKIKNEITNYKRGSKARIILKINALTTQSIKDILIKAANTGIKIDLIIRGASCIIPSLIKSGNIKIYSVVGRFLEHSRIFYFYNKGKEDIFLSSADCMDRNLYKRIEIAIPIFDKKLKLRIINEGLLAHLRNNYSLWKMQNNGTYKKSNQKLPYSECSQEKLLKKIATNKKS